MDTNGGMTCKTTEASWPVAESERLSGTQAHRLMRSDEADEAQYIHESYARYLHARDQLASGVH